MIAANLTPDHSTIADFRCLHETALGEVLSAVLGLCARAGLVKVGVIAVDGTKVLANASHERSVEYGQVAREILAEADRIDREEDELYGDGRRDELPEQLRTAAGRRAALREAKQQLERERRPVSTATRSSPAAGITAAPRSRRAWTGTRCWLPATGRGGKAGWWMPAIS